MKRYIFRRLGYAIISLVLLSATIFVFVRLTGDPTVLLVEPGASRGDIEALREDLGLDQPLWVQYGAFVKNLVHGDFGSSFYYRTPVLELYLSRLPHSLLLATTAMVFSLLIGIPSGVLAAVLVGFEHAAAPGHARGRPGLVLRGCAHAPNPLVDARGARLGVREAGPAQGPAR